MPSKLLSAIVVGLAPRLLGNYASIISTDYQVLANQGLDFGVLPIGMSKGWSMNMINFEIKCGCGGIRK